MTNKNYFIRLLLFLEGFLYLVDSNRKPYTMKYEVFTNSLRGISKMSKKILTLAFAFTLALSASAQKIKVKQSNENIGGGSHNALNVTLYGINPSDAEDAFRSFMKKYDGKRSSKDGAIFVDHATIKEFGNNTIDIYGKAQGKKGDPEITFVVAFDLGGAFLNSGDHKTQYNEAEKIVKEFAVKATKDAIE